MATVKLLSNLQTESGVLAEGEVVDLPDAQAEHLVALGAAEVSDGKVTAKVPKAKEVEPAADPLAPTQADGESTQTAPVTPQPTPSTEPTEQATPPTPPPSEPTSPNLHLG